MVSSELKWTGWACVASASNVTGALMRQVILAKVFVPLGEKRGVKNFFTLSKDLDTNVPIPMAAKTPRKVGIVRGNFKTPQVKSSEAIRSPNLSRESDRFACGSLLFKNDESKLKCSYR
jgi:hypothetical protein